MLNTPIYLVLYMSIVYTRDKYNPDISIYINTN